MNAKPLYLYGAGGLGREIAAMVRQLPEWKVAGFFDDKVPKGTHVAGVEVAGGLEAVIRAGSINLVITIGDPGARAAVAKKLNGSDVQFPSLVHPGAILQDKDRINVGPGAVICAGSVLTTDIHIGAHVLLNLNVTCGHDTLVGDCSSVMPGVNIAGQVTIGQDVLIGVGANLLNNLHIGNGARIGAGAVVRMDVPPGATAVGVPARILSK